MKKDHCNCTVILILFSDIFNSEAQRGTDEQTQRREETTT